MTYPMQLNTAPGFEAVAEQFEAHFKADLEHGASFCVMRDGEYLVDLIGGWADRAKTQALRHDHLISVYSTGKAVAALIIATLVDDNRLGYEQDIKTIWPEFGTHGKGHLSVAQVLSHQAGLSGITNPDWTPFDWLDWEKTCNELANQAPIFEPGSRSGYSPITFGFLAGEIARRTDPEGRRLGEILREDLIGHHDLDIWLGLPASEHDRCARMLKPTRHAKMGDVTDAKRAAFLRPWSSTAKVPTKDWLQADLAGSNCQATARGLAAFMQLAVDGSIQGEKVLSEDVLAAFRKPRISGPDEVLPFDITFSAGIMSNTPNPFYGPHLETVGHSGWGGSCAFADPVTGISAAYVMTQQDNTLIGDERPLALIKALYEAL